MHACRKSSTYQLLTFISELNNLNFSALVVQKFTLDRETLKMKVVLVLKLCNLLLNTTRIIYANTYDNSGKLETQITRVRHSVKIENRKI